MKKTYFSRRFKQLTGFGFRKYLIGIRIQKAEQLLTQTKLSISEISELCGFSSRHYWGDIFHHCNGLSPSQCRQK